MPPLCASPGAPHVGCTGPLDGCNTERSSGSTRTHLAQALFRRAVSQQPPLVVRQGLRAHDPRILAVLTPHPASRPVPWWKAPSRPGAGLPCACRDSTRAPCGGRRGSSSGSGGGSGGTCDGTANGCRTLRLPSEVSAADQACARRRRMRTTRASERGGPQELTSILQEMPTCTWKQQSSPGDTMCRQDVLSVSGVRSAGCETYMPNATKTKVFEQRRRRVPCTSDTCNCRCVLCPEMLFVYTAVIVQHVQRNALMS